ncbi:MAG: hypothetical protein WCJ35_26860 [Planctomycetota bacterium]
MLKLFTLWLALVSCVILRVAQAQEKNLGSTLRDFLAHSIQLLEEKQYDQFVKTSLSRNALREELRDGTFRQLISAYEYKGPRVLKKLQKASLRTPLICQDGRTATVVVAETKAEGYTMFQEWVSVRYTGGCWYIDGWGWLHADGIPTHIEVDPKTMNEFFRHRHVEEVAFLRRRREKEEEAQRQALNGPLPGSMVLTTEMRVNARARIDSAIQSLEKRRFDESLVKMFGRKMLLKMSDDSGLSKASHLLGNAELYAQFLCQARDGTVSVDGLAEEATFVKREGEQRAAVTLVYEAGHWYIQSISGIRVVWGDP